MQLIGSGREASVYLNEDGRVIWIADGPEAHETSAIGWMLCQDRLYPPHFPQVYEIGRWNGKLCVTMEYVSGRLVEWSDEQAQVILDELKIANVLHRDIRPEHLIVRPTGEWCLIDFGWACDYGNVYPGPHALGGKYYKARKPDDAYAMEKVRGEIGLDKDELSELLNYSEVP
jgi:serine/threonine protein kinase